MPRYSPGIILIWNTAANEAVACGAEEIEPAHLLLGLCRFCDLDLEGLFAGNLRGGFLIRRQIEAQRDGLRAFFERLAIEPGHLRLRLRTIISQPRLGLAVFPSDQIHRSPEARDVFRQAERLAESRPVAPVDLIVSLLRLHDTPWDTLIAEMANQDLLHEIVGQARPAEALSEGGDYPEREVSGDEESGAPEELIDEPPPPSFPFRRSFPQPRLSGSRLPGLSGAGGGTPNLNRYGRDLSKLAKEGALDPVIGRELEMRTLARVLAQKRKNNAILVGEAGVGKTCIVEGLAQALISETAHAALKNRRIVEISMTSLVAGTKYRGEFEERIEAIIREASADRNIILFIDEIHTVLSAGAAEGALDAANILKPALARGDLRCIGATTVAEYRKYVERDPALERRFQMIWVEEPTLDETVDILRGLRPRFEEHHGLKIGDDAIEAAVRLSVRYLPDFRLPDKAVDLIDQACAGARIMSLSAPALDPADLAPEDMTEGDIIDIIPAAPADSPAEPPEPDLEPAAVEIEVGGLMRLDPRQTKKLRPLELVQVSEHSELSPASTLCIGRAEISTLVAQRCRLPVDELEADEAVRLLHMEDALRQRVIGQEEAIAEVSYAVRTARAGLKDPNKPVGAFMFVGATGTGKTELAKALADFLFGDERFLIRIDMSEYMEKSSVARLIGAPPGYIGHGDEGQLTGPVRSHPYSVVLFDEIEKAHPEVLDILLQILDQGILTDARGRHVSFRETIVILTSNLGGQLTSTANRPLGFGRSAYSASPEDQRRYSQQLMSAVMASFRPELLNRIRQVVVFYPLGEETVRQIIDKFLGSLHLRLGSLDLRLHLSEAAYGLLMQDGYDPRFGAREMERAIDRLLIRPLSTALLEGRFPEGARVAVDVLDGQLVLEDMDSGVWDDGGQLVG